LTFVPSSYKLKDTVIEQRKNQRFDLRLPFEIIGGAPRTKSKGETRNVSSAGVLFTSQAPVKVGESIEYMITLPKVPGSRTDVRLRCVGKVLRSEDPQSAFAATLERYEFVRQRA
jgi:PilZ domain-containing protein